MNQRRLAHMLPRDCPVFGLSTPAMRVLGMEGGRSRLRRVNSTWTIQNLENRSISDSEYTAPKKEKSAKIRPPVSAGSRKTKDTALPESSGSDHPPQSRKPKKIQRQDEEEDEGAASDISAPRDDENSKADEDETAPPQVAVSPSIFLSSSKPLSAMATSTLNPAAAALAALAVISDSVENSTETTLDLKNPTSTTRKSPTHEPPPSIFPAEETTPCHVREQLDAHYRDLRSFRTIRGGLPSRQGGCPIQKSRRSI